MDTNAKKTGLLTSLNNKIKDIRIAMLTSINSWGSPHTRPMASVEMDYNGTLWFFTNIFSVKINEINNNDRVSISYVNESKDIFVCISGRAEAVSDREKMEKLWEPKFKTWFPEGLNDPTLGLLKVKMNSAEYWDHARKEMVQMIEEEVSEFEFN